MTIMKDIEALIESLSPKEIKTIMDEVKSKKPTRVDHSRRARSIALTSLYFDNAPRPKDNFEEYLLHAEGLREQVISGVDICRKKN